MSRGGSDYTEFDFKQQTMKLFKEEQRDFIDIKFWEILRHEPRWMSVRKTDTIFYVFFLILNICFFCKAQILIGGINGKESQESVTCASNE